MANYSIQLDESVFPSDTLSVSNPILAVTDSVRTNASTMLRLLRRPLRYVTIDLPPVFSQLEPGQWVWAHHRLLPECEPEWDGKLWKLVPLLVVTVTDHVLPHKVTLKCVDLREHFCTWWSPLITDIGMTPDMNGIAIIDRAGGWATVRNQLAYGERPGGDNAYQEVLADAPIIDRFGLLVQGGHDINRLLNSTFSEGAAVNWTHVTSGAAVVNLWQLYTLIDAPGFQKAIQIATYAAGENAYIHQTAAVLDNPHYVRVFYKDGGAFDRMSVRIQRSSDSKYYRDSDQTWQVSAVNNTISPATGVINSLMWVSKAIDPESATNFTVSVGHFAAVSSLPQISQIQGVELLSVPVQTGPWARWRSPLPTKAAMVTRVVQTTRIVNDTAVQVVSPIRGFGKVTFRPAWNHEDLLDGQRKHLWAADFDEAGNSSFIRCCYQRTNSTQGEWQLYKPSGTEMAVFAVEDPDLPAIYESYTVATRWNSEAHDEHGLDGQALEIWVDGVYGTPFIGGLEQTPDAECGVYLGCAPNSGNAEDQADGHLTDVVFGIHCPTEQQLLRM